MTRKTHTPTKGLKPLREIAEELGISLRTVGKDYRHAINKLRHVPGAFELILHAIHAVEAQEHDSLHCASVECNKEFLALFADKKDMRGRKKERPQK
jgi:DNA-binding transcriptional MocR family regulator